MNAVRVEENRGVKIRSRQFHIWEEVEMDIRELLQMQEPDFYSYRISKTRVKFKTNTSTHSGIMMKNNDFSMEQINHI
jgi:hypothetical protein